MNIKSHYLCLFLLTHYTKLSTLAACELYEAKNVHKTNLDDVKAHTTITKNMTRGFHGGKSVNKLSFTSKKNEVKDVKYEINKYSTIAKDERKQISINAGVAYFIDAFIDWTESFLGSGKNQLVIVSSAHDRHVVAEIVSKLTSLGVATILVDVNDIGDVFSKRSWRDPYSIFSSLLVVHLWSSDFRNLHRLFGSAKSLMKQFKYVIVIGERDSEAILYHPSLENVVHVLFFVVTANNNNFQLSLSGGQLNGIANKLDYLEDTTRLPLTGIYRRCLYCNNGGPGIRPLPSLETKSSSAILDYFAEPLQNLNGHKLKIVALSYFPYINYDKSEGRITLKTGVDSFLLRILAGAANFTYTLQEPDDGHFGSLLENGSWNGIVGYLERGEADLCLLIGPSAGRLKVMDFSTRFVEDELVIISLKPQLSPRHLALLRPLAENVWLMLLTVTGVVSICLWALGYARSRLLESRVDFSITASVFSTTRTLLNQVFPAGEPRHKAAQILTRFWLFCSLIMISAYQSSLAAHLMVRTRSPPVNSFQDLVSRDGWTWSAENNFRRMRIGSALMRSKDKVTQEVMLRLKEETQVEGLKNILKGRHALISFKTNIESVIMENFTYATGRHPFHLTTGSSLFKTSFGWGFRKGGPIINLFNGIITRVFEAGFPKYWLSLSMKSKEDEAKHFRSSLVIPQALDDTKDVENVALGFDHLQGAFLILLLGQTLATIAFLGEKLMQRRTQRP